MEAADGFASSPTDHGFVARFVIPAVRLRASNSTESDPHGATSTASVRRVDHASVSRFLRSNRIFAGCPTRHSMPNSSRDPGTAASRRSLRFAPPRNLLGPRKTLVLHSLRGKVFASPGVRQLSVSVNRLLTTFANPKRIFLASRCALQRSGTDSRNQNPVPFCKKSCLRTS
jgi:hypothetical protein